MSIDSSSPPPPPPSPRLDWMLNKQCNEIAEEETLILEDRSLATEISIMRIGRRQKRNSESFLDTDPHPQEPVLIRDAH